MSFMCLLGFLLSLKIAVKFFLIGSPILLDCKLSLGDVISVKLGLNEDSLNIVPTEIPLNIIYEDDYLLILDKPARIPVHPSASHFEDSLSNGVKFYFDSIGLHRKIRIVNRLDKDTSGIVIFAKCEYVQEILTLQMKKQLFKKEYLGIMERYFR